MVILGAGLDTRVYRIDQLRFGENLVYEIDFSEINHYKEEILENEHPLCQLIRISTDLSNSNLISQLLRSGFSSDSPSLWILEGLAYYMAKENFESLLSQISNMGLNDCQLFVDLCAPVCAEVDFGPFFAISSGG